MIGGPFGPYERAMIAIKAGRSASDSICIWIGVIFNANEGTAMDYVHAAMLFSHGHDALMSLMSDNRVGELGGE